MNKIKSITWVVLCFVSNFILKRGKPLRGLYSFIYRYIYPLTLGFTEPGTATLIKKLLKEGMTFVDLGASKGIYTLLAAKIVGEKGKVFAFEPAPDNFEILKRNVRRLKNVTVIQKAISNRTGTAQLFLSLSDSVSHRIYGAQDRRNSIEVETTTLDDFFKDKDCKIDLVKMDIEGAEMRALEGMEKVMKQNENLMLITEFYPRLLKLSGSSPEKLLRELTEYGFKIQLIDEERRALFPADVERIFELLSERKAERAKPLLQKIRHKIEER